jgi:hypothetical protein
MGKDENPLYHPSRLYPSIRPPPPPPNQKKMCGEVIESADTVFHFDPLVCERLFDVIDGDTDGKLTVQKIMTSGSDPKVRRREDPTNRCMNERVDTMARIHWSARMKERVCVCVRISE